VRLAVVSDIHANREALEVVLESIGNASIDRIVCLGDLVGYGVDYEYCISAVSEHAHISLMGNHDSAVIGTDSPTGSPWQMNPQARKSAEWTMKNLSADQRDYLSSLEMSHSQEDLLFVHSAPTSPGKWYYISDPVSAALHFSSFEEHLCFVGHSHIPGIYFQDEEYRHYVEGEVELPSEKRAIINVGSAGQPRDGDPRACYIVLDTMKETAEFTRVAYDIQKATDKTLKVGVSESHASRLFLGI
jgi:diadenosine tetraphosphatase ApaH/serine/threonine PP2A family protein phosphatase